MEVELRAATVVALVVVVVTGWLCVDGDHKANESAGRSQASALQQSVLVSGDYYVSTEQVPGLRCHPLSMIPTLE
jgi:hypothetical protein